MLLLLYLVFKVAHAQLETELDMIELENFHPMKQRKVCYLSLFHWMKAHLHVYPTPSEAIMVLVYNGE